MNKLPTNEVRSRIRIYRSEAIAIGPGKAELLEKIAATGSLSQAARDMKMSYMKAWSLVRIMNQSFRRPLVEAERGGTGGGGMGLTTQGKRVLALYREMEKAGAKAIRPQADKLLRMLKAR